MTTVWCSKVNGDGFRHSLHTRKQNQVYKDLNKRSITPFSKAEYNLGTYWYEYEDSVRLLGCWAASAARLAARCSPGGPHLQPCGEEFQVDFQLVTLFSLLSSLLPLLESRNH